MPSTASGGSGQLPKQNQKQKQKQKANGLEKPAIDSLPWTSIVQGQVSRLPIVFSRDAEFFFVVALSSVKIYSRTTGQLVSTLSSAASTSNKPTWSGRQVAESHIAPITGLLINPANPLQLLTCSLDGTIKVWDYLDAKLLRTIDVAFPISTMVAHSSFKGSVFVALQKPKSQGSSDSSPVNPFVYSGRCNSIIQIVSLNTVSTKGAGSTKSQSITRVGKARQTTAMALSSDSKYLVLIGKRKVHIARTEALKEGFTKVISDQELTCLAFHPENNTFATGDTIGQIRLWYFLDEQQKGLKSAKGLLVAPSVLLHWHAHAVSALTFSPNGANLLSGGEESVMVLWQIATKNREYVPRLGGATIESITVLNSRQGQEEEYVASLADGSITFVSAINLKPNRTISQVLIDSSRQLLGKEYLLQLSLPLAVQPLTKHLVMNAGHSSSLQFFDVEADRLVSQMEIVPSNRVSRPDDIPIEQSRVELVCFSSTGDWMATSESRGSRDTALKVWRWNTKLKTYTLNSRIEDPHKGAKVISMSFSPRALNGSSSISSTSSSPLLLTAGEDHQVKMWRKVTQEVKGANKEEFWIARSSFDYRRLPIAEACWEPNGSLVAVAHDKLVTVWEPLSNSLQQVIPTSGKSKGVIFAGKGGRYVVALSDCNVVVWDIVFGQVSWEKEVEADYVVAEGDGRFCLLSKQRNSTIATSYSPKSSEELSHNQLPLSLRQICKAAEEDVQGSLSVPCFYALTSDFDVIRAGISSNQETALPGHAPQSIRGITVKRRTMLDELIGLSQEQIQSTEAIMSTSISSQKNAKVASSLLEVASHLLPPISTLYEPLIQEMLPKRRVVEPTKKVPVVDEAETNSGEEEEKASKAENGRPRRGLNRLRQVSQMDYSALSTLFEKQASLSVSLPTVTTPNGKLTNGIKKSQVNASPSKKSSQKKVAALSNGDSTTSTAAHDESVDTSIRSSGRKRKQLVE